MRIFVSDICDYTIVQLLYGEHISVLSKLDSLYITRHAALFRSVGQQV